MATNPMGDTARKRGQSRGARRVSRGIFALVLGIGLAAGGLLSPPRVQAAESSGGSRSAPIGDQIYDASVLRPLGAVSTLVGSLFFVASSPFAAVSWRFDESWDFFVQPSYEFTFTRDLGDL